MPAEMAALTADGFKDDFAQAGNRQQDKDQTVDENQHQRVGIGEPHAEADRIDEECVQAHAGGLCEGQVGKQADQQRAKDCGNCGCDVDRAIAHTVKVCKHPRIDHQDICHGHKRGDARNQFCANRGLALF